MPPCILVMLGRALRAACIGSIFRCKIVCVDEFN